MYKIKRLPRGSRWIRCSQSPTTL
ncbi:hypothetical protein DXU77_24910 [Pseudomonas lactis]|nr:hypothetical protein [Pseudomonas lactis]